MVENSKLTLLITVPVTPELTEQIHAIAPECRIVAKDDLEADPELIAQVDVVYGVLERDYFPRATRLKWLQTTFDGMEWAAAPEIRAHPVILTNARIHDVPISEHLFGMLLMLIRQLHTAYRQQLSGNIDRRDYMRTVDELPGKTLCLVGLGVIGQRCAAIGKVFGLRVIGVRRHAAPVEGIEQVFPVEKLHEALVQADVVMVLLPSTPDSYQLINHDAFAAMKRDCYFFNAGRGKTVDTAALLEAVENGTIKGAGLDVTDPEPLPLDHPLWQKPNVIITPHYSGARPHYMEHANEIFFENLRRFLAGEPLRFVVSKEAGY